MAINHWMLLRNEVAVASLLKQDFAAKDQIPLAERIWQQAARLERSYDRAQRSLHRVQTERRLESARQPDLPASAPPPVVEEIPAAAEAPPASSPPRPAANVVYIAPLPPSVETPR